MMEGWNGHRRPNLSPLRYPGGKAVLYPRLREIVRTNGLSGETYVEPYAGGAGAALALLFTGEVKRVVINDLDPAIYAFWRSVVLRSKEFSERVAKVPLTFEEWERQRAIYRNGPFADSFELGFATFYLNRTNRSGALNGGVIGGKQQTGSYRIDARFNRQALLEKIRLIELYSKKIEVRGDDGITVIEEYVADPKAMIFADPPYFERAGTLYMNSFGPEDHARLSDCLNAHAKSNWVLTYDDVPAVHRLYSKRKKDFLPLHYSAHRVADVNEVIVYSDRVASSMS